MNRRSRSDGDVGRHRGLKVIGAAAAVLAIAAAVLVLTGHHSIRPDVPEAPAPLAPAGTGRSVGPTTPAADTAAGAARVAAAIVADEPLLVEGTGAAATALVDSWTTPGARPAIERSFVSARSGFVNAKGGPYGLDTALLALRVTTTGPGRVRVDAWCAEVLLERGTPASGLYVTERLNLAWTAGRWLLTSISDTPGPSVGLAGTPTPAAEAGAALAGFTPAAAVEGTPGTQGGR